MNNIHLYEPEHKLSEVSVLYHDNEEHQIEEFLQNIDISRFNKFESTTDSNSALGLIATGMFDIFICDFRLPGKIDGVEMIRLGKERKSDLKGILYTGFALDKHKISQCEELGIRRAKKLEPDMLNPLISVAANEVVNLKTDFDNEVNIAEIDLEVFDGESFFAEYEFELSPKEKERLKLLKQNYHILAADLIRDYKRLPNPQTVSIFFGYKNPVTAEDILQDLEDLTPRGVKMIRDWIEGRQMLKQTSIKK